MAYAVFNLRLENTWNNQRNNDAIWLFFKLKTSKGLIKHISIAPTGHQVVNVFSGEDPSLKFNTSADGVGVFIYPSIRYKGNIEVSLKVLLRPESFEGIETRNSSFDVFGIEMVKIPSGSYFVGLPNNLGRNRGVLYNPTENQSLIEVDSDSQEFEISQSGDIYYMSTEGYEGDQKGQIPITFPRGLQSFFIMKYELKEGQYVKFLNNLSESQVRKRIIHKEENYEGFIELDKNKFTSRYPDRPCSFVGWDDAMAYADWAGLRPMTELEYTKAARGPSRPVGIDYPWGLSGKETVQRLPDANGNMIMLNGLEESELSDDNKNHFGASYYWVMDLAGSLWERVITIGHENGRNFKGTHGDGVLTNEGEATNEDWPNGIENSGGIGFRGGGFYGYNREYHDFNPFSPVSFRPYGGWHGSMRTISYGTRFVRTSN
ncbi:SUMF1/EgtB/PvdO family nonheme iron enzyme [Ulvibacterium sp.]|uniref:SUMF1/EgtB/PvdO family nonheme iron enzyme n=1 Tax=Ulvibacterium sp. TaxID=2665914 RepID=UPI003CC65316